MGDSDKTKGMSREEPLSANGAGGFGDAQTSEISQGQSIYAQGQSHDFGGSDDAYGGKGLDGGIGGGVLSPGHGSARTATLSLGGKTVPLSLNQPIYRNMQDKPAIFFKIMNCIVAIFLCAAAIYRFFASFGGHIVEIRCKEDTITGLKNSSGTEVNDSFDCADLLPFVEPSPDGFELFVQSCFVILFTSVNVLEEIDYNRVANIVNTYASFMSSLAFRGLYLLFIASLVMTASHTFLLFAGALAMTVAFLYILLWGLSHFTSHGQSLGLEEYNQQIGNDFEAPLPSNLKGQGQGQG